MWRIHVHADDASGRPSKIRIVARHLTVQTMRLQLCLRENALNGRVAHPWVGRQLSTRPVRIAIRPLLLYTTRDPGLYHPCRGAGSTSLCLGSKPAIPLSSFLES